MEHKPWHVCQNSACAVMCCFQVCLARAIFAGAAVHVFLSCIACMQVYKAVKGGVQDVIVKVLTSADSELATTDLRKVHLQPQCTRLCTKT